MRHARCVVPDELLPRWRDLPALGWLVTRRFGGALVRIPVLGLVACAVTWPLTMTTLIGHRADRTLAAHCRSAVVAVRVREPASLSWRRMLASTAATPAAFAMLCGPLLALLAAAAVAAAAGRPDLGAVLVLVGLLLDAVTAVLVLASVDAAVRSIAPVQRRAARAEARRRGTLLPEAHALAACSSDRRAATVLVRRLLRHADSRRAALIANSRDDSVATMYRRLKFRPVRPGGDRVLVRWSRP
jgi:hypothetical protein